MRKNFLMAAAAAVLIVFMVLLFVSFNPWLLPGVPAVLWAVSGIVRAIDFSSRRRRSDD